MSLPILVGVDFQGSSMPAVSAFNLPSCLSCHVKGWGVPKSQAFRLQGRAICEDLNHSPTSEGLVLHAWEGLVTLLP